MGGYKLDGNWVMEVGGKMEIKTIKYAIHLDNEKRIDGFTYEQYAEEQYPDCSYAIVDTLPDGDVTDYKYINGEYVHDPKPKPDPPEPEPTAEEDTLSMIVDHEYRLTMLELGVTE